MSQQNNFTCDGCGTTGSTDGGYLPTGWTQPVIPASNANPRVNPRRDDFEPDLCYRCADKLHDAARAFVRGLRNKPIAVPK